MEVMAAHNTTHESLNTPHETPHDICHVDSHTRDIPPTQTRDSIASIGCQTALSYARQDTLVPLTALLQLVNNSILTVMENIEKVLLVNSADENVFTPDSITSFWNAANNSTSTSPTNSGEQEQSPPEFIDSEELNPEESSVADKLMRPIVIQDRFQNSLEIPTIRNEMIPPAEKRFCSSESSLHPSLHPSPSSFSVSSSQLGDRSPTTITTTPCIPHSLSPTVNVAGSLTKYICPYCYKVFNWKTNMNRHISVTHLMKPKPTIKVPIMRKSKPYTCPICGNTFAWRSNMNRHILHLHKIDHKQLNKLLLSAYLPDLRNPESTTTASAAVGGEAASFSSLGSLTMLPQGRAYIKTPPPAPAATPTTASSDISFIYRNHKALLESVKKEQVPLHVKEAALTSFYQNNKALFDTPPLYKPEHDRTSPKAVTTPPPTTNIGNLSVLYQAQKALLEQQQQRANSSQEMPLTNFYQNHLAMLDKVSLLSNLGGMNIANGAMPSSDVDTQSIKVENMEK